MPRTRRKLTLKQEEFVRQYLIDLNATQSAIRAGYSQRRAMEIGWQLLQKTTVQEAIQKAMDRRAKRTEVTADRVVKEYARLAFSSMPHFMSWSQDNVEFIPSEDLSEDDAACVAEISQTTTEHGGTLRLKLHDKKGALDALARHLKLDAAKERHALVLEDGEALVLDEELTSTIDEMETRHHVNGTASGSA